MNFDELIEEIRQYSDLAANECVIEVRLHLFDIIKTLLTLAVKEFDEEVSNER